MMVSEFDIGLKFALDNKIPHWDNQFPIHKSPQLSSLISYSTAKKNSIVPLAIDNTSISVGTSLPQKTEIYQSIQWQTNLRIVIYYFPNELLLETQKYFYQSKSNHNTFDVVNVSSSNPGEQSFHYDLVDDLNDDATIRALNLLISEAIEEGASDIHLEPNSRGMRVRFRIDGLLQEKNSSIENEGAKIAARIKVLAKLDVAQSRIPQDGRIHLSLGERVIDTRVSTIPTLHGERVVLRLLDKKTLILDMNDLGIPNHSLEKIEKALNSQEGMIVVTGPTGSGKTTTLYSFLSSLKSSQKNIMTVEDPVEYHLNGISQTNTQSNIGLTFSKGLKHILRQDPDVIMIGEIRDTETAEISFQASLTGHLVLTTLHANSAPGTIIRLLDMGIEPILINSTLLLSVSQRLLRKICPHCSQKHVIYRKLQTYKGKGCHQCSGTGYKGRVPAFEIMVIDEEIRNAITNKSSASDLFSIARSQGMVSLREACLKLAERGITSIEEVYRVS